MGVRLCRGDVDDRVLLEAMLPLLDQLAGSKDVRPLLHKRFNMQRWLRSHGLTSPKPVQPAGTPLGLTFHGNHGTACICEHLYNCHGCF